MFDTSDMAASPSPSSPAGSPAREPAPLGSGRGSGIPRPFCGESSGEPFASFGPGTCWWRMWPTSSLFTGARSGERFSGTWPRSGTTSSGIAFQQQPSALLTDVTGSSPLLATPDASVANYAEDPDEWQARADRLKVKHGNSNGHGTPLAVQVKMLPTPATADADRTSDTYGRGNPTLKGSLTLLPTPRSSDMNGAGEMDLRTAVKLLPTPRENDGSRPSMRRSSPDFSPTLGERVELLSNGATTSPPSAAGKPSTGLRLSPSFVEWMIGAPQGWTDPDCPLSATEFKSRSEGSPASTSSASNESERA